MAGAEFFRKARYEQAKKVFEQVRLEAETPPDPYDQIRAITNIGGCWFALHQYKQALKSFLEARQLAEKERDASASAALDANIASLYSEMGERDAAIAWLQKSLANWRGEEQARHLPQLQFEMGSLRARQNRMAEARELFRKGIDAAAKSGNQALVAVGLNKLGEELLRAGQIEAAEGPLLHAFYIRKLNHLSLEGSYTNLGKLRLSQGLLDPASALLDRGIDLSRRSPAAMPVWDAYLARGELHLAQKQYRDALEDMRIAVRLARAWRWSLPADDASHVGAEGLLDRIYTGLVEAGNQLYLESGDPHLVRETFQAAEENRAMSLRMLIQDRQEEASEMPATYWEAVAKLQRAEVNALRRSDPDAVGDARAEWIREEAAAAPDLAPLPSESLEQLKAALHPGTVLLSFRLGAPASWVWALDRSGLALYQLPSRAEIQSLAEDASRAIREGDSRSESPARLYRVLFAGLAPRFLNQSRWLLALDPGLMNIPFGALEVTGGTHPSYVAEHHVVETIPGAGYWIEAASRRSRPDPAGLFVGIGDPIYNMADSRLPQASPRGRPHARWSLFAASHENFALPRLLGSGAEVEQCARTWKGRSVLLRGTDASGDRVRETLRRGPEVVHFAVHFVESSAPRFQALMALGMGGGEPELIGPVEVSHWRTRASLVVLSGCNSAAGEQLPGTGLMGLTRAWLTAGARSVLGSRWATPDEEGALFAAFYSDYGANGVDAAAALARAQIRMIREGGWRSKPSYWGAWFVVGN